MWDKYKEVIKLMLVIVLTLLCLFMIIDVKTGKFKIKLGLDLRSGCHLTVRLLSSTDPRTGQPRIIDQPIIRQTIAILEKRLNPLGTSEVIIQQEGLDRIVIEIPEETDLQRVEENIKKNAYLDFREQRFNPTTQEMEWKTTKLDGSMLLKAEAGYSGDKNPQVMFEFTKEGAKEFAKITENNIDKPLGIFLDGVLIDAPTVKEPITGGSGVIHGGSMTIDDCFNLAVLLNAGALPVPIEIMESMTIGPTLGQESLMKSMWAGIVGLGLVLIFMIAYYMVPGVMANFALIFYTIALLATMVVGDFVLTLPGIAGIILSIGMAVDANILIFERLKEELWEGKSIRSAVETGFKRAFSSILDSHVTTLIGALVLYYLGSSSVKGFGLTLMLGTVLSMITAVFVTRIFVDYLVKNNIFVSKKAFGG